MKAIHAEGGVFDKDGCLYRYPANYPRLCDESAVYALFKCLNEIPPKDNNFEDLVKTAAQSFRETGCPAYRFSQDYGIDHANLDAIRHEILPVEPLMPITQLPSKFMRVSRQGFKLHLATHSHQNFTRRSIPRLGLSQTFNMKQNVYTLDQFGHQHSKCKSPKMIVEAANNMRLDVSEIAFFEDTAKNFTHIKDHDHRVKTVLITWGRDVEKTSEIDFIFRDPLEALSAVRPPERKTMVFMRPR